MQNEFKLIIVIHRTLRAKEKMNLRISQLYRPQTCIKYNNMAFCLRPNESKAKSIFQNERLNPAETAVTSNRKYHKQNQNRRLAVATSEETTKTGVE